MNIRFAPAFLIAGTALTACSGSGGNSAMNPVAFTSFSAVQNGQPVTANGISQTVSSVGTPTTLNPVDTANSTAQLTFSGIGSGAPAISAFSFSTPTSSASFPSTTPIDCTTVPGECSASNINSIGKVINALDSSVGWNYQSFGYWLVNLSFTSAIAGAISFGSPTPAAAIPTTSGAVYNGRSGGVYVDPTGLAFTYSGGMSSQVNFATRQIMFSVVPTTISPVSGGIAPSVSALGVSGTLSYLPGSNQFSGPVTAPGVTLGGLNGTATGNFYGPTAQELGGVFSLNNSSSREAMVGGFGGKR